MEYRVLARKYRPTNFDDLIGQETLVRTLSNAIKTNRIAHAFLLTGIRGIGKTTTARIIARALNCIGEDGNGGPTVSPCGVCPNCKMIGEDRHVDVLEMDAASHTGVGDIRELIDTVRYLPTSARYKIYIIDEVHMLSNSAFNALLKTLEEPPPHVKFVFATTEVRKIPVTILSRCQRFDLQRITTDMLARHLSNIAAKEQVKAEDEALQLISIAAEGSVRDSLSLLDQAIARGAQENGELTVTTNTVRQMIGAADHTATFRLLETMLSGDTAEALTQLAGLYGGGADPLVLLQDALETVHLITRVKVAPATMSDVSLSQVDRESAKKLADTLSMAVLTRLWQMLLKGVGEVRSAPSPLSALEMLLVRTCYAAQLPTPAEVIRSVDASASSAPTEKKTPELVVSRPAPLQAAPMQAEAPPAPAPINPTDYESVARLFEQNKEVLLANHLRTDTFLISFTQGAIVLKLAPGLPRDFLGKASEMLSRWTGTSWKFTVGEGDASPSLHEQASSRKEQLMKEASSHPLIAATLQHFSGAKLVGITSQS
jgi:DNA polymerase III subunit gamma/tau